MATVRELITRIIFQTNPNGLQQAQQATNAFRQNVNGANNVLSGLSARWIQAGSNIQRGMNGAAAATGRVNSAVTSLTAKLAPLMAAMGAFMSVGAVKNMADSTMGLDNRLRTIESDPAKRKELKNQLFEMAQTTRADYMSTGELFFGINRSIENNAKFTRDDAMRATEVVTKALSLQGASPEAAAGALLQLQQGLGSGRLQGDELHSLSENASLLTKAMAEAMGVEQGDLKDMGAKGLLTTEVVLDAIIKAGEKIDKSFGMSTQTISQSMQKISNSFYKATEEIEDRTHIFSRIAQFIDNNFQYITKVVKTAVAIWDNDLDDDTLAFAKEHPGLVRFIENLKKLEKILDRISNFNLDFSFDFDFSPLQIFFDLFEKISTLVSSFLTGLEQGWQFAKDYMSDGLKDLSAAWGNFMEALEPFMPFLSWLMEMLGTGLATVGVLAFRLIAWSIKKASEALKAMGDLVKWVAGLLSGLIDKAIEALKWLGLVDSKNQGISDATWQRAQQGWGLKSYTSTNTASNTYTQSNTFNVAPAQLYPAMQSASAWYDNYQ